MLDLRFARWRRIFLFLCASCLLHILFFLFFPAPAPEVRVVRFKVRSWPEFDHLRPFLAQRPDLPGGRMEQLGAPSFSEFPELAEFLDRLHYPKLPGVSIPRYSAADPIELATAKEEFEAPEVEMPDFDELALEAVQELAEGYEEYARFYLPDADGEDADSEGRLRARAIVERAIAAMGGIEALLAVRELRAKVWIQSNKHSSFGADVAQGRR